MSHTYSSLFVHVVFSTKDRRKLITPQIEGRLWAYLGGIARENKFKALTVGGVEDHVHALLSTPPTLPVAKAVRLLKGGSSKWVHDTFPEQRYFAWQEGYGAFSIGASGVEATIQYIDSQTEHHHVRFFEEEYTAFLAKHHIQYDPRYVLG